MNHTETVKLARQGLIGMDEDYFNSIGWLASDEEVLEYQQRIFASVTSIFGELPMSERYIEC